MGGAVSSGRDNNELIDNLMGGNYIRTRAVERVFRALDRAEYMTPESRDQAYKDLAWRNGAIHLSSPCIYSEVMEGLELRPGLSFLNVGSGTGYLSTMVGLILGSGGISHGIEINSTVVEYANKKLGQFLDNSPTLDEFDFCQPKFYIGNGLCLRPHHQAYDRLYCGASCPSEYEQYFKKLIKVGGVLVMPLNETLMQVRRVSERKWVSRSLLTVSFASLRSPPDQYHIDYINLDEHTPPRLQLVARAAIRAGMRRGVMRRHPELREPAPRRAPPAACPRRICIPIEPGGAAARSLNILHDLDAETGANEMNALLSLVIRMDQNRVAGAISFNGGDTSTSSEGRSRSDGQSNSDGSSDEGGDPRPRPNDRRSGAARAGSSASAPRDKKGPKSDSKSSHEGAGKKDKDGGKSDRKNCGDGAGTSDKSGRKTDRRNGDRGGGGSKDKGGRGDGADDKGNKTDKGKKAGTSSGRMWAFEFQAREAAAARGFSTMQPPPCEHDDFSDGGTRLEPCGCEDEGVLPSEVELCFQERKGYSRMRRFVDCTESTDSEDEVVVREPSSSEESSGVEDTTSKAKRQKLDSGIGENTPRASSPDRHRCGCSDSDSSDRSDRSEAVAQNSATGASTRRRFHKRSRHPARASSSSAEEGASSTARPPRASFSTIPWVEAGASSARRRTPRRGRGFDARRVRLSIVMKRAIKELPLPYPLKKYVNLGRCFEI